MANSNDVTSMAVFCDFENIALGARDAKYDKVDIARILERLLLKGTIVVKKAYCDWDRYKAFKAPMHEASFELIEIPHVRQSGKNSADIRMVVDALDLCYMKPHVDTFVIISGDSDFSPLVSKLRENNKGVIGVGVKNSTSDLFISNCDEFIFYDDLVREKTRRVARKSAAKTPSRKKGAAAAMDAEPAAHAADVPEKKTPSPPARSRRRKTSSEAEAAPPAEPTEETHDIPPGGSAPGEDRRQQALELIAETVEALTTERGADDKVWGSMVKQAIKRRNPGFNESYYGFRSFNGLLEEAERLGAFKLERDDKSGGYVVRLLVDEA